MGEVFHEAIFAVAHCGRIRTSFCHPSIADAQPDEGSVIRQHDSVAEFPARGEVGDPADRQESTNLVTEK
jgi:hypothetical protein